MTDENEIRDLLATYALTLDVDDIDGCLALFTADGEFVVYGKTLSGPDRIRTMLTRAPRGLHMTGAARVDIEDNAATVRAQVLFVDAATHQLRPALYDDEVIRVNMKWRFRRRRCQFITSTGLSGSPQEPTP